MPYLGMDPKISSGALPSEDHVKDSLPFAEIPGMNLHQAVLAINLRPVAHIVNLPLVAVDQVGQRMAHAGNSIVIYARQDEMAGYSV